MKAETVLRHTRNVERAIERYRNASAVGVTRLYGEPIVGDLAPSLFARLGLIMAVGRLENALSQWIFEQAATGETT